MRLHLRLVALCSVAALAAAGCAKNDNSTNGMNSTHRLVAPSDVCMINIGDRVWYDTNCNGIQDKDETGGPEGVKVTLINCDDTNIKYGTATDSNGNYNFNVPTGTYQICIEIPGGFAPTIEDANNDSMDGLDSDINSSGCTGCRTYTCDSDYSRDAGLCEKKAPEGTEGCTPGFWRNHLTWWACAGISPNDKVNATFGCKLVSDDNLTLGVVIDKPQTYGTLPFHAIAALLNASCGQVDFGLSADEVKDLACAGDKDTLADENEKGCPLSGGNTTGKGGNK